MDFVTQTRKNAWMLQEEDYDLHQEIARSAFADMLHDWDRNQKYEIALKAAIDKMHSQGHKANVLDIGTGTGLLSMMAVRNGADTVIACEAFAPMSECALKVIETNGFKDRITVIPKTSTKLTVGINGDLKSRCNILVTEVFDTELIGEGALKTFIHAHKVLLEDDCIVVPESGTIYAQIVESPLINNWNKVQNVYSDDGELLVAVPTEIRDCHGGAAVHDLHLSQIPRDKFKELSEIIPVLHFDWSGKEALKYDGSVRHQVVVKETGVAHAVLMWWDLKMADGVTLSCAPNYTNESPWRDHWLQAIYYLVPQTLERGREITLISSHDEYSLWYSINTELSCKPVCTCGVHVLVSRTRIGQINDTKRTKKLLQVLEQCCVKDSVILLMGDAFYGGLAACKLGAKKVYCVNTHFLSRKILTAFTQANNITNLEIVEKLEDLTETIDVVIAEPYLYTSLLPWDNLSFLYDIKSIRGQLATNAQILPGVAIIKAIAVSFTDLHKIRAPLGHCEGFKMDDFDKLIFKSSELTDENVEAQPLWEFPGKALSDVIHIGSVNISSVEEQKFTTVGVIDIDRRAGDCNGIAVWVDWEFDPSTVISTGPTKFPKIGKYIEWDMHTRQGVALFPSSESEHIKYKFQFNIRDGEINFLFT